MLLPVHRILLNRIFLLLHTAIKAKATGQNSLRKWLTLKSYRRYVIYKICFEAEKTLKDNPDENYALINLDINNFQLSMTFSVMTKATEL